MLASSKSLIIFFVLFNDLEENCGEANSADPKPGISGFQASMSAGDFRLGAHFYCGI